ncbi:MAG: hypothetical protein ABW043_04195 [Devosia sp.]|uniref:hypothetical protein n=1 Tax=Devosia sp. TaxID=1871048 RepID=UPI003396AA1B
MFRTAVLVAAISLATLPAFAQDVNEVEGHYSGSGEGDLTLDLTHIEDDRYSISINTVVPIQEEFMGCAGGIDGEVLLSKKGGNFFVENEMYEPGNDSPLNQRYCEIGLIFDGEEGVVIEERDGCLEYHGASCGFSGTLTHDAAGI